VKDVKPHSQSPAKETLPAHFAQFRTAKGGFSSKRQRPILRPEPGATSSAQGSASAGPAVSLATPTSAGQSSRGGLGPGAAQLLLTASEAPTTRLSAALIKDPQQPAQPSELLSRREAAHILAVHPNTITNMIKRGELAGIKVAGSVRVRRRDVMKIVEHGTRAPKEGSSRSSHPGPTAQGADKAERLA
jgi:excisionase family DNA binding protein